MDERIAKQTSNVSDYAPSKKQYQDQTLNNQGDGPHPNKTPHNLVNATNYPLQISMGSYQADITPRKSKLT